MSTNKNYILEFKENIVTYDEVIENLKKYPDKKYSTSYWFDSYLSYDNCVFTTHIIDNECNIKYSIKNNEDSLFFLKLASDDGLLWTEWTPDKFKVWSILYNIASF